MAAACFAVSAAVLPLDTRANWYRQAEDQLTYEHWAKVGALRLSQVGELLLGLNKILIFIKWLCFSVNITVVIIYVHYRVCCVNRYGPFRECRCSNVYCSTS